MDRIPSRFRPSQKYTFRINDLVWYRRKVVPYLFTCRRRADIRNYSYNGRGMQVRSSTAKRESELERALAAERMAKSGMTAPRPSARPETGSPAESLSKLAPRDRMMATCDGVVDIAAALFNVSSKELRGPDRCSLAVARVRQIAMYVTHVTLGISMRDVGQGFGRDRTTVLHACHLIEDMRDDLEFDRVVAMVERVIRAAFGRAARS